jgi:hypothetical protein
MGQAHKRSNIITRCFVSIDYSRTVGFNLKQSKGRLTSIFCYQATVALYYMCSKHVVMNSPYGVLAYTVSGGLNPC